MSELIELTAFGSQPNGSVLRGADTDVPSPDGRLHAVVVRRGDVTQNVNVFSLLVFQTDQLFRHPRPDTLVTLASSSNRPGIGSVRWLGDSRTLLFLGEGPGELPRVYALDVQTKTISVRVQHATEITHFNVAPNGERVIYTAKEPVDTSGYGHMRARGFAVRPGQFVGDVLTGTWAEAASVWAPRSHAQTFIWQEGMTAPQLAQLPGPQYRDCDPTSIAVAPASRLALIRCTRAQAPAAWSGYADPYLARRLEQDGRLPEFALLDLVRGTVTALVEAPSLGASAVWAPTGTTVVLGNAFLPLVGVDSTERRIRAEHPGLAEVDALTGKLTVIAHRDSLDVVDWRAGTNIVDFVPGRYSLGRIDGPRVRYQKTIRGWREVKGGRTVNAPLLVVEQGINESPRLVAVDRRSKQRATVFNPNPGLEELTLGRVEIVHWRTRSGDARYGGLYYPPDFSKGRRYPLVIQTHGFDSTAWAPDGFYPTANAAQPTAAEGMLVLQIGASSDNSWSQLADMSSPGEGQRAMEEIESAIDQLDSLGLVDRSRVGLNGFSRTCYHVLYTLTHSKYQFAAASVTDGLDFSYLQYILFRNAHLGWGMTYDDSGVINGNPPFGKALDLWRERAPGFNLDRVSAPVRLVAIGLESVLEEWEPFAGLLLQRKPAELFVIPGGTHILVKPWERLASSQSNVDWFRFWLKDEEDPDPAKAEQYARWHELRKLQEQQTASDTVASKPGE